MSIREGRLQKRTILTAVILVTILLLSGLGLAHEIQLSHAQRDFAALLEANAGRFNEGRLVLASTSSREAQRIADTLGGSLRITKNGRFALVTLPDGLTLADVAENRELRQYMTDFSLDYNDFSVGMEDTDVAADGDIRANFQSEEPMYPQQTYLDYINIGDSWNVSMGKKPGGEKVKVAVIDSGIDTDHPEFTDVDGNSIISTMSYDATDDKIVENDGISVIEDEHGHGTAVASVIASQINGKGIMGIAPDVELLVIKCDVNEAGQFVSGADIIFGIYYAIEQDVDVINMSLGSKSGDLLLEQALKLAVDSDIIPVASAGNDYTEFPHYPSSLETTIGVGALGTNSWELAEYSNFGVNSDIIAPGTTLTAEIGGTYAMGAGTSLAAPIVSAAVAIYRTQHPYATFDQVKADLLAAGKDLGELGEDNYFGFGVLDMNAFICEEKGKITYDYCTEDIEPTSQVFVKQHTIQTVPEPEREYVIFDDWYYDKSYTRVFDYDAWYTTEFVEDVTLYARWANEDDDGISAFNYMTLDDGTIEITGYKGKRRFLTVPEEIDGMTVSSIGIGAFAKNTRLREVVLPAGLTQIRENAFFEVSRLRKVTFTGTALESIESGAFEKCNSLTGLSLPDSVVTIGANAFQGCTALSTVEISPESALEILGDKAFAGTALSELYLPVGVTEFNGGVLAYCRNMRTIEIHPENQVFILHNGAVLSADGMKFVYYPAALTGMLNVPEGVTEISAYACTASALNGVTLPKSLVWIGTQCFAQSELTEIQIPAAVQKIGPGAFRKCEKLKQVNFADGAQLYNIEGNLVDGGAFEECSQISEIVLPDSLQFIGAHCFKKCTGIREMVIPVNTDMIEDAAFSYCTRLESLTFAEGCVLEAIPRQCFEYCSSLKVVNFSNAIRSLGDYAFFCNFSLQTLDFEADSTLTSVGNWCFQWCSALEQLQLPAGVNSIGKYAYSFSGLTAVHIPAMLTSIGDSAFGACEMLTQITVDDDHIFYAAMDNVLFSKDFTIIYCVPASRSGTYTMPDTVKITAPGSFYYDRHLMAVILPDGLQEIQHDSFYSCSSLQRIEIPGSVTNIGRNGFYECSSLSKVAFEEDSQLRRLGIYTFVSCGITEITIPASVETMAQSVFSNCNNLKKITFASGSKLSYLAAYLFSGTPVEHVIFEDGSSLKHLQAHAFSGARYLKSVDFGDAAVDTIDNYAFYECSALEQITIPETVTYLGRYVFYGCSNLRRMDIPAAVEYLGISAFDGTKEIRVFFAADDLPAYAQDGWDTGIIGYFMAAREYVSTTEWEYVITHHNTVDLVRYLGAANELTIDTISGYPVEKIGAGCFAGNQTLTAVTLSAGVREIGPEAFLNSMAIVTIPEASVLEKIGHDAFCGNSTVSLKLPDSVTYIGASAFENSSLTHLTITQDSELKEISNRAFCGTGITSLWLPATMECVGAEAFLNTVDLTEIGIAQGDTPLKLSNSAFEGSSIEGVVIPSRVWYLGEYVFGSCSNLKYIEVNDANTSYQDLDGILIDSSGTILIQYPAGREGPFEVPEQISVLTYASFKNAKGLTEVTFASGSRVRTIGWQTFAGCHSLKKITIPDSVISFDVYAFENCKSLTSVVLGENSQISGVYAGAFSGCSELTGLHLPDTVIDIGDYAFYGCTALTEFPLTEYAQTKGIGAHAFDGCSGIVEIPEIEPLTEIGDYAFAHTGIVTYTITENVLEIGENVFSDCWNLMEFHCDENNQMYSAIDGVLYQDVGESEIDMKLIAWPASKLVVIGEGKTEITEEDTAFLREHQVVNWEIADSVTTIKSGAFANIRMLKKVIIPSSITKIESNAFAGCWSLEDIRFNANLETTAHGIFDRAGISSDELIVTFGEGVTSVPAYLFSGADGVKQVIFPETLTSIGQSAFYGCTDLEFINIPDTVKTVGSCAFEECSGAKKVYIGTGVETIEPWAFRYCTGLEEIHFCAVAMNDVSSNGIFPEVGLTSGGVNLLIGAEVTRIPDYAFTPSGSNGYRNGLVSVRFESGSICESIGESAFYRCDQLEILELPDSIVSIGKQAFSDCNGLKWMNLPKDLKTVDMLAFSGCTNLSEIHYQAEAMADLTAYNYVFSAAGKNGDGIRLVVSANVERLPDYLFFPADFSTSVPKLTSVVFEEGSVCTAIGCCTFKNCNNLSSINIPQHLESIDTEAFMNCSALGIVRIDSSEIAAQLTSTTACSRLCEAANTILVSSDVSKIGSYIIRNYAHQVELTVEGTTYSSYSDHTHDWTVVDVVEYIACLQDGHTSYVCRSCGLQKYEHFHAHDFEEIIVEPTTCLTDGLGAKTCRDCATVIHYTIPSVGGHLTGSWYTVEKASGEYAGLSRRDCVNCGEYYETGDFETIATGKSSVHSEWVLKSTGELWIYGSGSMGEWNGSASTPWYSHRSTITSVVISEGITSVGENAFNGCSNLTSISIPEGVTGIGDNAFRDCGKLVNITIPQSVLSIGEFAFCNCTALECIVIPDGVTKMNYAVFRGCKNLASVTLPESLTVIGYDAFASCSSLKQITIPNKVTTINQRAFLNCSSLEEVCFPASLTSFSEDAFSGCSSVMAFHVDDNNRSYKSIDGVLFNKAFKTIVKCPPRRQGSFAIPEGVTTIGRSAFSDCALLESITIPDSVQRINASAFSYCSSLTTIAIPEGVTSLPESVFVGCSSLTTITIPDTVKNLGNGVFYGCNSLTSVTIPDSMTSLGSNLFRDCSSLTEIEIPAGVTSLGSGVFQGCSSLTEIEIPAGVTSLGSSVFQGCSSLTEIELPEGVTSLGYSAFRECSALTTIEIPAGVTSLSSSMFLNCSSLKEIKLPEGVTSLEYSVFENCTALAEINIPESVTSLGRSAFCGCSELTAIEIPASLTSVSSYAFYKCSSLKSIVFSDKVTSLETGAFMDCTSLKEIELPKGLTNVGGQVFHGCISLTEVTFTGKAPTIRYSAFNNVTASVYYPSGDQSWTSSVMQNYGGKLTWMAFCVEHMWGDWYVSRAVSCMEAGENRRDCEYCDHYETDAIPATGHSYCSAVTVPSCLEQGYTTHTCTACGDSYKDTYVDALGHEMDEWMLFKEATCTEDGENRRNCSACSYYETEVIPATGHSYESVVTAPTCTEQGYTTHTCTVCGDSYVDTYVDALGHDMGEWSTVTEATCTDDGSERRDCSRCDHYATRIVKATGHSFGAWFVNRAATCTEDGENRRNCNNCNHYETEIIPATDHDYESVVTAPTCTEQGYTTHTCANCGDSYVDTYVDALGHDMGEWTTITEATCTEDGSERRDCSRCDHYETRIVKATDHSFGAWFVNRAATCTEAGENRRNCNNCSHYETEVIPAKGHSYESVVTAPTCVEKGYTTHTCANCGDSYVDTYVDALGHDMGEWITVTEATCTEDGSERRDCSRCDHYETRIVKANGHSFGAWFVNRSATCTEDGENRRNCSVCGHYETEVIPATGHSYESVVTAPTCMEQGYTTHTCANCGDSYVDTYVDALGHDMGEWTTVTEATCNDDGSERRDCSRCDHYETRTIEATGHSFGAWFVNRSATCTKDGESRRNCSNCSHYETEVIPATGHSYESVVTAPTCVEQGYTTHTCGNCGDSYVDTYVDALGHDMGEWITVKEATCNDDGSERRDCYRCDHYETRTIKATGHSFGAWFVNRAATCTEDGENRRNCTNCSHYETEVIPATGHSYESVVTAPTCVEKGYTTHTCTACGDSYVDAYVDALGHEMGEWITVTEATCTMDGQEIRDCSRCDHYETRIIEAPGHSYDAAVTKPTCTEQGYTRYVCAVCGDSYISDYVAPTGHAHEAVVTAPNCTEQGYTTYTCHCGDCYVSDYTDPLGHDMGAWEISNDATCTENGQELRECSCCDHSETREIEALGHEWDEGVVTVEPTEETEGEMTYTCERCSETRTEIIPTLEHEHRYEAVITNPTCMERGYTTYTCRCGDSYMDSYVDALGHDMGEWFNVTEPTCTADGLEQCDCSRCDYHEARVIEATGHNYESVVTDSTCIAQGFTTHTCHCGDTYTDSYTAALGHSFTEYASDSNATCTQDGTKTSICDRCDATDTVIDEGSAHGHDFTEWTMVQKPTETVEGLESRYCLSCGVEETRTVACLENPFGDVPFGAFYYEPVMWAVENGITNGTSATTFGPDDQCMRAHVVTFLWRAVGSPEPTKTDNPFVDVKPSDFYYKPVLWALENGITSGMDATHFGPTSYCNRAQVVTFLYRTMGSPELESMSNPFADVEAGAFYEKPVLWAVENGITNGLSATSFGPNSICNRAQIVTFLYRAFVND